MAQPIEKFQCKGCQTRLPTPIIETDRSTSPTKGIQPNLRSPPSIAPPTIELPTQTSTDGAQKRVVSPTPSEVSNASNAFYVCHEGDGIKLVGYKPRRQEKHDPQLCTHHEEEELPPEHYHFSRKHPNEVEDPNASLNLPLATNSKLSPNTPNPLTTRHSRSPSPNSLPLAKDPRSYPSPMSPSQLNPQIQHPKNIPTPPPLPPTDVMKTGQPRSRFSSPNIPSPPLLPPLNFHNADSRVHDRRNLSPSIHKPTAFSPVRPKSPTKVNKSPIERSPGKYPPVGDIFPPPPSTLSTHSPGREKGRVSFVDPGNQSALNYSPSSNQKRNSKLETLF